MVSVIDALMLDLLESLEAQPRSYGEVMEGWRSSCPRLDIWETALERGFVRRESLPGAGPLVVLTPEGRSFISSSRPRREREILTARRG